MKKISLYMTPVLTLTWSMLSFTAPTMAQELNLGPVIYPGIAGQAAA